MAIAIMVSTFGTVNAMTLAGARVFYAMAHDGLFFRRAGTLNRASVPGWGLAIQGIWTVFLVLPRTWNPITQQYGNLYSNLLDYVISAALLFYILDYRRSDSAADQAAGCESTVSRVGVSVVAVALYCGRQRDCGGAVCVSAGDHVAGIGDCGGGGSDLCGDALAEPSEHNFERNFQPADRPAIRAKARQIFWPYMARLKPCPDTKPRFVNSNGAIAIIFLCAASKGSGATCRARSRHLHWRAAYVAACGEHLLF